VPASGMTAAAPRHEICRRVHRESCGGIHVAHGSPTKGICMLVKDQLICRVSRRKPVPVWLRQWTVSYRFTRVLRVAAPVSPEAQPISEPA
jgi:hypothetical protein